MFSLLTPAFLKNYESVVRRLAERGHEVQLVFHGTSSAKGVEALCERLCAESPLITSIEAPTPRKDPWLNFAVDLRAAGDYVHFQDDRFHDTYRKRANKRAPGGIQRLLKKQPWRTGLGRYALKVGLGVAESATPINRSLRYFIAAQRPDVVLFTPLIGLRTIQPQFLRAAQSLGLRTAVCISSWDNLSSKSKLRPVPDLVLVWNKTQQREAVELHGIPAKRVAVTGAQCYDQWFTWEPRSRAEFLGSVGLDPAKPYLLYAGSTPFLGSPDECDYVQRWITELRASDDPALRDVGLLVRPHPKRARSFVATDFSRFGNVAVHPRVENQIPIDYETKADFFDSIYHSAAVVGLNTSAMIEAGVVGRTVYSLLVDEYWDSQSGTLHFPYLVEVGGGLVKTADSMGEHLRQLSDCLSGKTPPTDNRPFLESFVRPFGLEIPGTPILVDRLEELAGMGPAHRRTHWALAPFRPALKPFTRRSSRAKKKGLVVGA